jgi:hypothetical protein
MPPKRRARRNRANKSAFLNLPYDEKFKDLFLAYIAGVSAFGLVPRATLEIPGGKRRLDRILQLIRDCRFSIHDLSRVELDHSNPPTPRFNMPFELGLTVGSRPRHTWFVFESKTVACRNRSAISTEPTFTSMKARHAEFFENSATHLLVTSGSPRCKRWSSFIAG